MEILQRFQNKYDRIIVNASWSSMTLYIIVSTYHTLEIKRLSQRYADEAERHPDILATNLTKQVKTTGRLKRRPRQDLCT